MRAPNKSEIRAGLTVLMIFSMVGLFALIFLVELPNNNKDMAYLLVGAFSGSFTTIIAFWYGSSQGSVDKGEQLNNIK